VNELLWRKKNTHGEFSRKFVHLSVGSFVAFWPFFLSWRDIKLLAVLMFFVVIASKYLKIFQAIHSVQRATWGEASFALSLLVIALITNNKWIYATAILQMSLSDGMAALVGVRYGKKYSYLIFNHTKSIIGTLTFFIVSFAILLGYSHFSGDHLSFVFITLTSLIASALENIAVFGLDNIVVPLVIAILLINH